MEGLESALEAAEEDKKTLSDIAEMNAQEAEKEKVAKEEALAEADRAKAEADELRRELEAIKSLPWWKKIFIQKNKE